MESLFHEWGHVLASVLSDTQFQQLAGTRAALDFVEAPSMLLERLAWHPLALPAHGGLSAAAAAAMREARRAAQAGETAAQLAQVSERLLSFFF